MMRMVLMMAAASALTACGGAGEITRGDLYDACMTQKRGEMDRARTMMRGSGLSESEQTDMLRLSREAGESECSCTADRMDEFSGDGLQALFDFYAEGGNPTGRFSENETLVLGECMIQAMGQTFEN